MRRRIAPRLFVALVGAAFAPIILEGCANEETIERAPALVAAELSTDGVGVKVLSDGTLSIEREGTTLVTVRLDDLALGVVDAVSPDVNYDPYPLIVESPLYPIPEALDWYTPRSAKVTNTRPAAIDVTLDYGSFEASLVVSVDAFHRIGLRWTALDSRVAYYRLGLRGDANEGLYGLGELFDDVNQRGKKRAMQLELGGGLESSNNEAHVPIPLLLGTTGWGAFVDSFRPIAFDVAATDPERVDVYVGTGLATKDGLSVYLFAEDHPLDLTRHYYELTGAPALPAAWGLGPLVWRNENEDGAEFLRDVNAMRDLDLAASGIWIDRPYATGVNTFDFDERFPEPGAMIATAQDLGFRVALWHVPYLDDQDPATAALVEEAEANGYYPEKLGLLLNKWGRLIDLTKPEARTFWQGNLKRYVDLGIEGFKLDYGEDVVTGPVAQRTPWLFADGTDEQTAHATFTLAYHSTYAEMIPPEDRFLICRHATVGEQSTGLIIWPGDLDASFTKQGEETPEGDSTYVSVGGLPASVIATMSLGPSGFAFYGADTGGYRHSPPDKELTIRWFQQTAFSVVMQTGNGSSTVPWEADPATGYDTELLDLYRTYARLHLRLFPYLWTHAHRLTTTGRAIVQPLGLAYAELGEHPNDQYLLGDDILVAPIVARGAVNRSVLLPPGKWIDWWTRATYTGGVRLEVEAPLERIPVFLRAGGIIPLLRPTIDTLAPANASVDSFATDPDPLYFLVGTGNDGEFTLYDGTSLTYDEEETLTRITTSAGSEFSGRAIIELSPYAAPPTTVFVDGQPIPEREFSDLESGLEGYFYDASGRLYLSIFAGDHAIELRR